MLHDLKNRFYWRMIHVLGRGGLPEGEDFHSGHLNLDSAGTAQQLTATSTPLRAGVFFRKQKENVSSNYFYIGTDNTVSATANSIIVGNAMPVWIEVNDLSAIWFDGTTTDTDLSYMAV